MSIEDLAFKAWADLSREEREKVVVNWYNENRVLGGFSIKCDFDLGVPKDEVHFVDPTTGNTVAVIKQVGTND